MALQENHCNADLPVEENRTSVTPQGVETPVVYRHPTEQARDDFGKAEREALARRRSP